MTNQDLWNNLGNISDHYILDALPPTWQGSTPAPAPRRRLQTFGRFMDSGWVAAVLSVVVAIGVLTAIILAGRGEPVTPPAATAESTAAETDPTTDSVTGSLTDAESILVSVPDPDTETDPVTDPVTETEPESETESETLPESESETELLTETEPATETAPPVSLVGRPEGSTVVSVVTEDISLPDADEQTPPMQLRTSYLSLQAEPIAPYHDTVALHIELVNARDGTVMGDALYTGLVTLYARQGDAGTEYLLTEIGTPADQPDALRMALYLIRVEKDEYGVYRLIATERYAGNLDIVDGAVVDGDNVCRRISSAISIGLRNPSTALRIIANTDRQLEARLYTVEELDYVLQTYWYDYRYVDRITSLLFTDPPAVETGIPSTLPEGLTPVEVITVPYGDQEHLLRLTVYKTEPSENCLTGDGIHIELIRPYLISDDSGIVIDSATQKGDYTIYRTTDALGYRHLFFVGFIPHIYQEEGGVPRVFAHCGTIYLARENNGSWKLSSRNGTTQDLLLATDADMEASIPQYAEFEEHVATTLASAQSIEVVITSDLALTDYLDAHSSMTSTDAIRAYWQEEMGLLKLKERYFGED